MKAAIYARVSTDDQKCELQLEELRRYCLARDWTAIEYVDEGFSGTKASRPALDRLMKDALARKVDCVLVYKVDRFGRSVKNLSDLLSSLDSAGIRFVAISQGIDTDKANPTSRLLLHMLAAIAEFEAALIRERVLLGVRKYATTPERDRRSKSGKNLALGRPKRILDRSQVLTLRSEGASWRTIAQELGVSTMTAQRSIKA